MDFAHLANEARLDPLVGEPGAFGGVPLIAHLSRDARLVGGLGQRAALVQRVRERLLAIHVLTRADRGHRGHGVNVVGRADGHGVDVVRLLVEHDAKILVAPRLGKGPIRAGGTLVVDVAQGDDVGAVAGVRGDVAATHSPRADARQVHALAGGQKTRAPQHMPRHDGKAHRERTGGG